MSKSCPNTVQALIYQQRCYRSPVLMIYVEKTRFSTLSFFVHSS
nr:MAG TPA_asm: hypothetical protein [Caudoviricetes sp.]